MNSAQVGDGRSPGPSPGDPAAGADPASDLGLTDLLHTRGAPLLEALESHFPRSREQSEAAASYAFAIGVELGMGRENAELARDVARLQNVGHVYVPAGALARAPAQRSPEDLALLATNYEKGSQLARGAGLPDQVCEWIRLGAERYDGTGPNGLAAAAIPMQARISRVAYAGYDALAAAEAVPFGPSPAAILRGLAGRELDPRMVEALATVLGRVG